MNPTTYEDFVASRFKTGEQILNDMNAKGLEKAMTRLHAVIGLITELDEIQFATSLENFIEELGDYYFYLTALKQASQYKNKSAELEDQASWKEARHHAAILLDLCKKEVMYAKELSPAQIEAFEASVSVMYGYLYFGLYDVLLTEEQLQEFNMVKLNKRYPVGYTNEAAAARADKTEGVRDDEC